MQPAAFSLSFRHATHSLLSGLTQAHHVDAVCAMPPLALLVGKLVREHLHSRVLALQCGSKLSLEQVRAVARLL